MGYRCWLRCTCPRGLAHYEEPTHLGVRIFFLLESGWEVAQLLNPIPTPSITCVFDAALGHVIIASDVAQEEKYHGVARGDCEARKSHYFEVHKEKRVRPG